MSQYKVSVIMASYNGEKYISDAIQSLLDQTFQDWELVVCDDCSTDNTYQILKGYAEKYPDKFQVLHNEKNLRLAASLNRCIEYTRGEYIARMDDDDVSLPERFAKEVAYLDTHPDVSFVSANIKLFDEDGIWGIRKCSVELNPRNIYRYHPIVHPTVMIRKKDLVEVGGYTVSALTSRTEDYDLWCKLMHANKKAYNLDEIVLNYRENRTSMKKRKFQFRVDACKLALHWRKKLGLPVSENYYAYKHILHGLVPQVLIRYYHKRKFGKNL